MVYGGSSRTSPVHEDDDDSVQNNFRKGQNNFRCQQNNFQKQNGFQGFAQNLGQRSFSQNQKDFQQNSYFGYQNRYQNRIQHPSHKSFPTRHFEKIGVNGKKNVHFKPKYPCFPNPDLKQKMTTSFVKQSVSVSFFFF